MFNRRVSLTDAFFRCCQYIVAAAYGCLVTIWHVYQHIVMFDKILGLSELTVDDDTLIDH